jgi:hypothetical protein
MKSGAGVLLGVRGGNPCSSLFFAAAALTDSAILALASSDIGFLVPVEGVCAIFLFVFDYEANIINHLQIKK